MRGPCASSIQMKLRLGGGMSWIVEQSRWKWICRALAALHRVKSILLSARTTSPCAVASKPLMGSPGHQSLFWVACLSCAFFGAPTITHAKETSPPVWRIDHYKHTAFSVDQGAPEDVAALAQTSDGYLWVGSGGSGLTRFDGLKFVPFVPIQGEHLLSAQVSTLFAAPDGGLWIGYEFQGVSLLMDGHLTHYTASDGYVIKFANKIFAGYRGQVYAVGTGRLLTLEGSKWSPVFIDATRKRVHAATADGKGTLWLAGEDHIYWCREDACHPTDAQVETPRRIINLAISPENVLFANEVNGATRRFRIDGFHLTELPALPIYTVAPAFDRHGGVWLPSLGNGVLRLSGQGDIRGDSQAKFTRDAYRKADGLTGDYVWPSLIDTEGDIWFGTQHGIDRFRETSLVNIATPSGLQSPKVIPAGHGEAWVASGLPLMRWEGTSLLSTALDAYTFAICSDKSTGKSWLANSDGLWELTDLGAQFIAPAPTRSQVSGIHLACVSAGHFLAAYQQPVGAYEWVHGQWKRRPEVDNAAMIAATQDGKFFVGRDHNRLLVMDGPQMHEYSSADGLNIGVTMAMATFKDVALLGGKGGLALFRNGHFQSLQMAGQKPFNNITGLAFDDSGALWVHMPDGAARVAEDEISLAIRDPRHALSYRWLTPIDGMPGIPAQGNPSPSLTKGSDGHLWFTSQSGIAWLDPNELVVNGQQPKPRIESLIVDGVRYPANQASLSLPPRPRAIEIDFNAPLLRAPEGGQFLYRLRGVDRDWQRAGNRREAFYSNLGPGDHEFQVRAANESGTWSEADASLIFHIQPAFYETWWFRTICALMILGTMCTGYALHIRLVTAKLRIREDERLRIARDLHDTLLQSVQAMLVKVEAIKDRTTDHWARAEAERVANWGRHAVSEGRTKVGRLRAREDESASPIREAIDIVRELSESSDVALHTTLMGDEPKLEFSAAHEVASVIREISTNALRHSAGKNLWLSIVFGNVEFIAVVKDDGRGIDENALASSKNSGHWGLKGARERICGLGGTLCIKEASPTGTEVTIRIPARCLYPRSTTISRA